MSAASSSPRRRRFDFGELGMQIFLISVGLIIAMPIIIAFFTSFKPPQEVITYPPRFWPSTWTLRNFEVAFSTNPFARARRPAQIGRAHV